MRPSGKRHFFPAFFRTVHRIDHLQADDWNRTMLPLLDASALQNRTVARSVQA
jgi:hypothetical protein